MLVTLLIILGITTIVTASGVLVVNPIDSQLPVIARIGQNYSWSFSSTTFRSSANQSLVYTASSLPSWLTFNAGTRTFQGTPDALDEGNPEINVTASDDTSSASSTFTVCVTHFSPPELHIPIAGQFYPNNPSLSSVFMVEHTSSLVTLNPALRVPPAWSFSIGFQGDTFTSDNNIYYDVLQANGSPLPPWANFNSNSVTLNGVAPHEGALISPMTLALALHASDQKGYTATTLPFDLIVAQNELSVSGSSLPTINITASTQFNLTLNSPADFSGLFLDQHPLDPANITALSIDVSQYYAWLKYDGQSMTLSGRPPDSLNPEQEGPNLPAALTTNFNQTLYTNISLAIVPSYFCGPKFDDMVVDPGEEFRFSLIQDLSNATNIATQHSDINLTMTLEPSEAGQYLSFDSELSLLTGSIPAGKDLNYNHVTATFTAYSHITHSTSHANLILAFSASNIGPGDVKHGHISSLSIAARKRLILGLSVSFGSIGGLITVGVLLAIFRHCVRVKDTALEGEEATRAWTAEERTWYGIGADVEKMARELVVGRGTQSMTGPSNGSDSTEKGSLEEARPAASLNPFDSIQNEQAETRVGRYAMLGLGLRRVTPRNESGQRSNTGVMSKGEFVGKIRETARHVSDKFRQVSDKYTRLRARRLRPIIGRPVQVTPGQEGTDTPISGLPLEDRRVHLQNSPPFPLGHYDSSRGTSLIDSPTSSSGGRSIPHRKADFTPRVTRLQAHRSSAGSFSTHAGEVTIHTASRATSMRSVNSTGGVSYHSQQENALGPKRPRVVQFTSSSRVPVPKLPSDRLLDSNDQNKQASGTNTRVASQIAKVFNAEETRTRGSLDLGMHYVNTLGEKLENGTVLTLNSSPRKIVTRETESVYKQTVKTGEKFVFRIEVNTTDIRPLEAKLASGESLPGFLHFELVGSREGSASTRAIEFYGVPVRAEIGEWSVEVYEKDQTESIVARVIVLVQDKVRS